MGERTCSVDGCESPTRRIVRGMCSKHYQRFVTHGTTEDRPPRRWNICSHPSCGRQARASGLCRTHAGGLPADTGEPLRHPLANDWGIDPYCVFPGCQNPHKVRGLCQQHKVQGDAADRVEPVTQGPPCAIGGCRQKVLTRGLCARHVYFRYVNMRQYGITIDQYDAMLASQNGSCAICGGVNANGKQLSVDHDHACCPGKSNSCGRCIRALLCSRCNFTLGNVEDDAGLLRAAANYLDNCRAISSQN